MQILYLDFHFSLFSLLWVLHLESWWQGSACKYMQSFLSLLVFRLMDAMPKQKEKNNEFYDPATNYLQNKNILKFKVYCFIWIIFLIFFYRGCHQSPRTTDYSISPLNMTVSWKFALYSQKSRTLSQLSVYSNMCLKNGSKNSMSSIVLT